MMVGEIRDVETAEIAIRAAMTGHLVFSTLHTNDAVGGITRLLDMGVEPVPARFGGASLSSRSAGAHDLSGLRRCRSIIRVEYLAEIGLSVESGTQIHARRGLRKLPANRVSRADARSTKSVW